MKNKINTWQVTTVVFVVLFLLAIFNVFSFSGSTTTITGNAVTYINENLLSDGSEANVVDTTKEHDLIKVTLDVDGQVIESYISKDGELLFPAAIPLTEQMDLGTTQPSTGVVDVSAADGASLGPEDAEIVVIEFSDFECPYCGLTVDEETAKTVFGPDYVSAVPKLEELAREGKIRFVFRHFPLSFHANAMPAALASECANEQGKFWEYHDLLFMNQDALSITDLKQYAVNLGLDATQFNTCLDTEKYSDKIAQDMADGESYGVTGTPAFFVNGMKVSGAQPFSAFEPLLNL